MPGENDRCGVGFLPVFPLAGFGFPKILVGNYVTNGRNRRNSHRESLGLRTFGRVALIGYVIQIVGLICSHFGTQDHVHFTARQIGRRNGLSKRSPHRLEKRGRHEESGRSTVFGDLDRSLERTIVPLTEIFLDFGCCNGNHARAPPDCSVCYVTYGFQSIRGALSGFASASAGSIQKRPRSPAASFVNCNELSRRFRCRKTSSGFPAPRSRARPNRGRNSRRSTGRTPCGWCRHRRWPGWWRPSLRGS